MEIRNCEEYVIAELEEAKSRILDLEETIESQVKRIDNLNKLRANLDERLSIIAKAFEMKKTSYDDSIWLSATVFSSNKDYEEIKAIVDGYGNNDEEDEEE